MTQRLRRICVFCGSQPGNHPDYVAAARQLGELLAARGIGLVFGGGHVGMMGAVADATLAAGGEAIGVIPDGLMRRELAYEGLSQLVVTQTMHQRKQRMADLSDGFIALPGGFGTFEEFCEIVTWAQLGMHRKPCVLLNVRGYYDALIGLFDHALREGFLRPAHRPLAMLAASAEAALAQMDAWQPPDLKQWMSPDAA